jgi:hypothetical protein
VQLVKSFSALSFHHQHKKTPTDCGWRLRRFCVSLPSAL